MATQVTASQPASFGKSGFGSSPTGPSGSGAAAVDTITELTANAGVTVDKLLTAGAGLTSTAGTTTLGTTNTGALASSTFAPTGAITPTGGIKGVSGSLTASCFTVHSGGVGVTAVATGTDKTATNTETYIVEVFVPVTTTFTGVSVLHLATSTGNVQFSMADRAGTVIATAQTAATAATASANYQKVPFAVAATLTGPDTYFILMQNSASNHFRAHAVGNFRADKKTGETFGTFTNVTPPTGFAADLGPICDLYV